MHTVLHIVSVTSSTIFTSFFLYLALAHDSFIECPASALKWEYRGPLLLQEILRSNADILCLEEVDHYQDFFEPQLAKHGYEGTFFPKHDSPCLYFPNNNGSDGCALLFRSVKFELVKKKGLTLRNTSGGDSNHVAVLVELRFKEPGKEKNNEGGAPEEGIVDPDANERDKISSRPSIYVALAHFKAKSEATQLREVQGKHLLEEMIAFSKPGSPVILAGDFNGSPVEPVYDYYFSPEAHPQLPLQSSYRTGSGEPEFTSWKIRAEGECKYTIDYIWYSHEVLRVKKVWAVPSSDAIGKAALPCMKYPSDHVALCAEFTITNLPEVEH